MNEVDINVLYVCNAPAHRCFFCEAAMPQQVQLTGTLRTFSGFVQAIGTSAPVPTVNSSRMPEPVHHVFVDLVCPRKLVSAGGLCT